MHCIIRSEICEMILSFRPQIWDKEYSAEIGAACLSVKNFILIMHVPLPQYRKVSWFPLFLFTVFWTPLPNVSWHYGTWPYTMTPSIDQTLHQFANLLPSWTLLPILTLLPNFGSFHRILQRLRLANRGRLLLRTPGPVPLGTCIWSNVETILSWTCHVYGPFEFRKSLGTSILL